MVVEYRMFIYNIYIYNQKSRKEPKSNLFDLLFVMMIDASAGESHS